MLFHIIIRDRTWLQYNCDKRKKNNLIKKSHIFRDQKLYMWCQNPIRVPQSKNSRFLTGLIWINRQTLQFIIVWPRPYTLKENLIDEEQHRESKKIHASPQTYEPIWFTQITTVYEEK